MQFQAMKPQAETKVVVETNICPHTSAMQARTQDATPEPAKQTGCQRAPGKVQLRLDPIWRAPCFAMQPARISRQNQTGLRGQSPYRARRQHCDCNSDSAMVTLPNICNHYATAMQASATAVRSKQRCSRRCSFERCNRRRNHSNTPQQAGAKANADPSTSPSETRMGQSIQTPVQPKCNAIATLAAWQHHRKRKCNAGVNTNATKLQT